MKLRQDLRLILWDTYQGREKDVFVLDAVRSNTEGTIGFLSDFHRLNDSITRARQKFVVIGDSATLSIDRVWAVFVEWVSDYRENPVSVSVTCLSSNCHRKVVGRVDIEGHSR
ncbi:unnamed protein product [Calypogeia fissa]